MFGRRRRSSSHHQVRSTPWDWRDRDTRPGQWTDILTPILSATPYACSAIRPIGREPCLLKIPAVVEQSLVRRGRRGIAQPLTYPNPGGKCPDQADGAAEVFDSASGESVDHPSLGKCEWHPSPVK
ncbi:hypothetical protein N7492_000389 [Penicillium capsulatum]|uniref:Uncharacterized protein n=1 Tax=Penicillium capsulatum TaxID=69766 RepID=A0A9W9IPG4_9EURO|nr:hypothetical protein N7492_000389 [Penicillium capsulatum]